MKKYGVVLIGCGHIGQQHIEDIYYRENIKIIGVVDKNMDQARLFAKKYGALNYDTDYKNLIASSETDIVIIASWVRSHVEILEACIANEKNVLCEKPLSANIDENEKAFRMIKNSSVKVQLSFVLRHNNTYKRIKSLIDSGIIGKLKLIKMVQNHHCMNWDRYRTLLEDAPSFFDCGVHYFDVIAWFTDSKIISVSGTGCNLDNDCNHENYGLIVTETESGCRGIYESGWSKQLPAETGKLFVGEKGYIKLTMADERSSNREEGDLITVYLSETGEYRSINSNETYKNMYGQIASLIDSIEEDSETIPSYTQMFDASSVAFSAMKAVRTGKMQFID